MWVIYLYFLEISGLLLFSFLMYKMYFLYSRCKQWFARLCCRLTGLSQILTFFQPRIAKYMRNTKCFGKKISHLPKIARSCTAPCMHCKDTGPKIGTKYSQKETCASSVLMSTYIHISVRYLYIPRSVCLFGCRKIGGLIVVNHKSLTDI